jgi:8-oxo-dGTP diphosphatase
VILDEEGKVLLVRHTYGRLNWELPGGMSEPGESVVETTLREVEEETGLTVIPERLTGLYYEPEADIHHFVLRCRVQKSDSPVANSPEISECGYWPPDEPPRPIRDFTVRRLQDALAPHSLDLPVEVPKRIWLS